MTDARRHCYTISSASAALGASTQYTRALVSSGQLRATRSPRGTLMIDPASVFEFIRASSQRYFDALAPERGIPSGNAFESQVSDG